MGFQDKLYTSVLCATSTVEVLTLHRSSCGHITMVNNAAQSAGYSSMVMFRLGNRPLGYMDYMKVVFVTYTGYRPIISIIKHNPAIKWQNKDADQ